MRVGYNGAVQSSGSPEPCAIRCYNSNGEYQCTYADQGGYPDPLRCDPELEAMLLEKASVCVPKLYFELDAVVYGIIMPKSRESLLLVPDACAAHPGDHTADGADSPYGPPKALSHVQLFFGVFLFPFVHSLISFLFEASVIQLADL